MRILIVSPYYAPEPFRVADTAAGLRARGHEVDVLTGLPNYPSGRFFPGYGFGGPFREVLDGIVVHRVPMVPRGRGGARRLALTYLSYTLTSALFAVLPRRRRWDVTFVVQMSPVTAIVPAAILRALHGIPMAVWVQDLWPQSVMSSGVVQSRLVFRAVSVLSRHLYRRADVVLGTSHSFQRHLEAMGVPSRRFAYLPQWAEDFFGAAGPTTKLPPGEWREKFPIMFAGNIGRVQALDTILDAAELTANDPDLRWVFVGDGSAREWLEREVARRGLAKRVYLLGRHPASDMPAFFAAAAAMIVSLKRDDTMALTIPGKLQAYLAAGRPILGSIDGEAARIIEESGAGFAAPAGDAAGLAEVALRLKSLPAPEREAMGKRGRHYSRTHFERERCFDRLDATLRALAEDVDLRPSATRSG